MKRKTCWTVFVLAVLILQVIFASRIHDLDLKLKAPCERIVFTSNTEILGSIDGIRDFSVVQESYLNVSNYGNTIEMVYSVGKDPDFGEDFLIEGEWYDESSIVVSEAMGGRISSAFKIKKEELIGSMCTVLADDRERIVTIKGICRDVDRTSRIYMSSGLMHYLTQSELGSMHVILERSGDIPEVRKELAAYGIDMDDEQYDSVVIAYGEMKLSGLIVLTALELAFVFAGLYLVRSYGKEGTVIAGRKLGFALITTVSIMLFFMIPSFNAYLKTNNIFISWISFAYVVLLYIVKETELLLIGRYGTRGRSI